MIWPSIILFFYGTIYLDFLEIYLNKSPTARGGVRVFAHILLLCWPLLVLTYLIRCAVGAPRR